MKQYIGVKIVKAKLMTAEEAEIVLQRDIDISNSTRNYFDAEVIRPDSVSIDKDGDEYIVPGYHVIYPDGYESWSPKKQFEQFNRPTENLTFGDAMSALKAGKKVAREGWNGKGMYCFAQFPDSGSKMTHPYLVMQIPECTEGTRLLPWQPAQVDIFAEDWVILD